MPQVQSNDDLSTYERQDAPRRRLGLPCPSSHPARTGPPIAAPKLAPAKTPNCRPHPLTPLSLSATLPKWYCTVHFSIPLVLFEDPSLPAKSSDTSPPAEQPGCIGLIGLRNRHSESSLSPRFVSPSRRRIPLPHLPPVFDLAG
ncbi:hypothetical protein DTO169E5_4961 [Paecilomyces variotii]|nr:hypothetical protein DTO169E5_4961 [Paecilomyces variotii]